MKNVKQRMMEDMKLRGLAPRTKDRYLHAIKALTEHYDRPPDKITEEQVRKYLLYLMETKEYAKSTFNVDLAAIKFLYRRTRGRNWRLLQIRSSRNNRRLPIVLSEGATPVKEMNISVGNALILSGLTEQQLLSK